MAFNKKLTVPRYDAPKKEETAPAPAADPAEDLRNAAISAVENQHGPFIRRNPRYEEMVRDAMRQISQAVEKNS